MPFRFTCSEALAAINSSYNEEEDEDYSPVDSPDSSDESSDDELVLSEEENDITDTLAAAMTDADVRRIPRYSCLAHLLQLAVKDAINASTLVVDIMETTSKIVAFFHKSNHYYSQLKALSGQLGLLKPCVTRWNSTYYCLERVAREEVCLSTLKFVTRE